MTTATASPAEMLVYLDGRIRKLNDQALHLREQLSGETVPGKTDYSKRAAVQAELDDIAAKLAGLQDERESAAAEAREERRRQAEHERTVADARRQYEATTRELAEELRKVQAARLNLVSLGERDPGDRTFSAEAIGGPLIERQRLEFEAMRSMFAADRATPAEVEADRRRQELTTELMNGGSLSNAEAKRIAAQVVDDGMTLEQALQQGADEEETDDEADLFGTD